MSLPSVLVGRGTERRRLERLLHEAHTGQSGVLVLRGGRGIGKSALLDHAARHAGGYLIVRLRGIEAESDLSYAALHMFCSTVGRAEDLPPQLRDALESAIAPAPEADVDRFLVGVAVLGLLAEVAQNRPLLCLVDDAQWLDRPSARVLAFVARRLEAVRVAMVFAESGAASATELQGLPELVLGGLTRQEAGSLLGSALLGRMDPAVVERIIAEAHGNPRALLESVAGLSAADLAGGYGVPVAHRPPSAVDAEIRARVGRLAPDARALLLAIAAEPTGDLALLWRIAGQLGVSADCVESLRDDGLLCFTTIVTFRDPALRSWIYSTACMEERNDAHRAVAGATDASADPDRHAWHLAHAVEAPDPASGEALARQAQRARERGGPAAVAAFLRRAAALTADPALRARYSLSAAAAAEEAGSAGRALRLLGSAELGALDESGRAECARLRARIRFTALPDRETARVLMNATHAAAGAQRERAAGIHLQALSAMILADGARGGLEAANTVSRALRDLAPQPPDVLDVLLDGLILRCRDGHGAATEPLALALKEIQRGDAGLLTDVVPASLSASLIAADLWDDAAWDAVTEKAVRDYGEGGILPAGPHILDQRALFLLHAGDLQAAGELVDEAASLAKALGHCLLSQTTSMLSALRGREITAPQSPDHGRRADPDVGEDFSRKAASVAAAVLYNGMRRHEEALAAGRRAWVADEPALANWGLREMIEAAVRIGEHEIAADALARLSRRTKRCSGAWARGIETCSHALLADEPTAEGQYLEAIDLLGRSRMRLDLARTQLLYGEWLRREGRRALARVPLRSAHEAFVSMGAEVFARRARRELLATGERTRNPGAATPVVLTPQETRIALFARDGLTNAEIGKELSVSPRTVEYHLHKVFTKLGVSSRNELHLVLDSSRPQARHRAW